MAMSQELQDLVKAISEQSQLAVARHAETTAKTNQDILERQLDYIMAMCAQQNNSTHELVRYMLVGQRCAKMETLLENISDRYMNPPQNIAPYDCQPQYSQSSYNYRPPSNQWSSGQQRRNYNNPNPRYHGRNYDPAYVPKHKRLSPTQNKAQSKQKSNQEN